MKNGTGETDFDYVVYTDGGYNMGRNVGAGAFVILDSDCERIVKRRAFVVRNETNNRAELKAIIGAIYNIPLGSRVCVRTDSRYCILVLTKKGNDGIKKNPDLIELYRKIKKERRLKVVFEWVKGHDKNRWNEECDSMCSEVADTGVGIKEGFAEPQNENPICAFNPPTLAEVRSYCAEEMLEIDPWRFVSYYKARGWMQGGRLMTDWKKACYEWDKRANEWGKY